MGQQTNHKQHTQTNHIIIFKLHNIQFSVRYDNDCNSLLSGGYSVLFSQWNHTLTQNRLAACALFSHHRRYIRQSTARLPLALASLKLRKLRTWVVTETSINEIKWRLLPCRLQVNQSCHARQTLVPGKISANTFTLTNYEMNLSHEYGPMGFAFQAKTRRAFSSQYTKSRLDAGFGWSLMKINFVLRGWFHVAFADQKLQHQSNQLTNSTADTYFLFYNLLHQTPMSFFSLDSAICEAAFCPQTRTQSHEGPASELFSGLARRPWSLSLTPASSHQFIQPGEQSQLSDIISLQPHHAIISTSTL